MADKKYQVFISSTYSDLKEERRKILDILLMADCIPSGMEAFVATDNEQFEVIKKVIDLCDYYVLIVGKRYGSVSSLTGKSFTEMEYDYAKSQDIPVLVFVFDESVELPEHKTEADIEKIELLKCFRQKAMANRLVSIWKSVDELTGALAISIMRAKSEITRPGWQRAVDYDENSLRKEIMNLQNEINHINKDLESAKTELKGFTEQTNLAFENCTYEIKYHYFNSYTRNKYDVKKALELSYLFKVMATEMLGVLITESKIQTVIENNCLQENYSCTIDNVQVIKLILNQLKALGLLRSQWESKNSTLYWGLTEKGIKARDDAILIRNS